jgi:hypothetical protein
VKITKNNLIFSDFFTTQLILSLRLYSDSARLFMKMGVLKLFFSCILIETERSEMPKLGTSSGHKSSNAYREQKRVSD